MFSFLDLISSMILLSSRKVILIYHIIWFSWVWSFIFTWRHVLMKASAWCCLLTSSSIVEFTFCATDMWMTNDSEINFMNSRLKCIIFFWYNRILYVNWIQKYQHLFGQLKNVLTEEIAGFKLYILLAFLLHFAHQFFRSMDFQAVHNKHNPLCVHWLHISHKW